MKTTTLFKNLLLFLLTFSLIAISCGKKDLIVETEKEEEQTEEEQEEPTNTGDILSIHSGWGNTFVITANGDLYGTGNNGYGQLGDASRGDRAPGFTKLAENVISVGGSVRHVAYLKKDGTVYGAGFNNEGQLALEIDERYYSFTQIAGATVPKGIKSLCVPHGNQTFIIDENDDLYVTGFNASKGILGLGDGGINIVVQNGFVKSAENVKAVSVGAGYAMLLKNDNTLWATGGSRDGLFGLGPEHVKKEYRSWVKIADNVKTMSAGGTASYIIYNDNTLWTAGSNTFGQLGNGTNNHSSEWVKMADNVKDVRAGEAFVLVLYNDDTLWGCGSSGSGQLGNGWASGYVTTLSKITDNVRDMQAGQAHTIVLKNDNTLWVTGANAGELGTTDPIRRTTLTQFELPKNND